MRILLSLLFLLTGLMASGQITAEKKSHNFGDLYPNAETSVEIKFTNNTGKKQYLLKVDRPRDVSYSLKNQTLLPDSSITITLGVNDANKGKFNHEVDIYFSDSDDPITIRLYGNVKEVSSNPLTDCPDFDSSPPRDGYRFAITVKVIDSLTREPIRRSKVYFVRNNELVGEYYTNKDGIIHKEFPMGYYFITAQKEAYFRNYKEGYLNFQRNYVEIELQQPPTEEEPPEIAWNEPDEPEESVEIEPGEPEEHEETEPGEPDDENEIVIDLTEPDPVAEEEVTDTIVEEEVVVEEPEYIDDTPLEELPDTLFDAAHFKMNNITFILDVSSSMNSSGKLDLLKLSMTELVKILREDDLISIIKYSSSVSVVVDGLSGQDKDEIMERVGKLRTSSSTAGGDAIKVAYRMNRKVYSPKRNNIVIMITDGAFNKGSKDYLETIEQNYNERGIIFSVVGIKTSPYLTEHMQKVVSKGGGDFIEVRTVADAQTKIIKEIKRTSFRGR